MRTDGRKHDELRVLKIIPEYIKHAEGSVRIELGSTHLICTASVDDGTPKWLAGTGSGWVTAEYGMLPRSTHSRIRRDKALSGGRTQEISRLIGRSLRAGVDLKALGERQVYIDCDVIQADGGTRTAAVSGGFVAMALAFKFLLDQGLLRTLPLKSYVAATSVGLKNNEAILDLNYDEDSTIETDMNFVLNHKEEFIEVQGTAEGAAFSQEALNQMIQLARTGCAQIIETQRQIIGDFYSGD